MTQTPNRPYGPVDIHAATGFVNILTGFTTVGEADGETLERPTSPAARAFLLAALGGNCPNNVFTSYITHRIVGNPSGLAPMAAFLRGVADFLDPATAKPSAGQLELPL